MSHRYSIKYVIQTDFGKDDKGHTLEEIMKDKAENEEIGACDAFIFTSIIRPPEGGISMQLHGVDGQLPSKQLASSEVFKIWSMMSSTLAEDVELPEWQRFVCMDAFKKVCQMIEMAKAHSEKKLEAH